MDTVKSVPSLKDLRSIVREAEDVTHELRVLQSKQRSINSKLIDALVQSNHIECLSINWAGVRRLRD